MTSDTEKKGLILLNLGTPDRPNPPSVKAYLKEFLMDPLVLDIPYFARWFLVNWMILPKRSVSSASAYQKVWTDRGSPLMFHHMDLTEKVQGTLGESWVVKPAMRYGRPNIASAMQDLCAKGVRDVTVFPLYPQYSLAATESGIREVNRAAKNLHPEAKLRFIDPFYRHDLFIESFAQVIQKHLQGYDYDHVLFSFHGLPERQVKRTDRTGAHCLSRPECCSEISQANPDCYRAQCYASANLIARKLGISPHLYSVSFQSRLGRTPWIQPFSDFLYRELPKKGIKKLAVVCPSFVADCLETLEEVQMRGKADFLQNGGEDLKLVPSLNASEVWVHAVSKIITQ